MQHDGFTDKRIEGHLKRLGPWLAFSLLFFVFVLPPLFNLLPERDASKPLNKVALKRIKSAKWMDNKTIRQKARKDKTRLKDKRQEKKEEKKIKKKTPVPEGQIVDIAMPEKEEAPDKAKYVSQYNSKVAKDTKAKVRRPARTTAPKVNLKGLKHKQQQVSKQENLIALNMKKKRGKKSIENMDSLLQIPKLKLKTDLKLEKDGRRGKFQNRDGQPTPMNGTAERLAMLIKKEQKNGAAGDSDISRRNNIPKSLLPSLSSVMETAGAPMNDYLKDAEEDDETGLNARSFIYATFYNQVKRKISQRWRPADVQRRYDPTHVIHGYQSRYTVVDITLDQKGNLHRIGVKRSCGVDFLDDEALEAVGKAAPFPNPPVGILEDDNFIRFPFGFYFEISRGIRF